jgi:hypothetical protein
MAKRVYKRPGWLKAFHVDEIYSVSGCISENFADYVEYWKHNGYWLFDSAEIIKNVAKENAIQLGETSLFYYEVFEMEFDGERWVPFLPEPSFATGDFLFALCEAGKADYLVTGDKSACWISHATGSRESSPRGNSRSCWR